jgi:hypothetical protein
MANLTSVATTQQPSAAAMLRGLVQGYWATQAVYIAAKLGIADLLKDGPKSPEAVARVAGTQPSALVRVLRLLASYGVFAEDADGRFALTPAAALLQTGSPNSLHHFALSPQLWWRSVGDLLYSVRTGDPAYDRQHGLAFHKAMEQDPEGAAIYDAILANATAQDAPALAAAYNYAGVHRVIDVGGGHGRFIAEILRKNPRLHGVLFDRPAVVAGAQRVIEAEGFANRCECVGGDFFEAVPVGGDVYVLKWVLIGWDDEHAQVLLRNCRTAMSDQATLLIVEPLIPPGNAPHLAKLLDVNMLVNFGGRVRTEAEYDALLAATGFKIVRTIPTATPQQYSVIEAKRTSGR